MTVPLRRQRAVARIREEILEAAARAFTKCGYHSASMRDIAREAGYTAAALYTYFRNKDEILDALASFLHQQFLIRFDEPMPAGLSFRQKLELLIQRHLSNAERYRDLYALIVTLHPPGSSRGNRRRRSSRERTYRSPFWHLEEQISRLAQWFRENASSADLGHHAPDVAARFLVSLGHGFLWEWVSQPPHETTTRHLGDLILTLFLHGIQGSHPTHGNEGGSQQ